MKHIILNSENEILQIGDEYTTPADIDLKKILGIDRAVHCLDGARYDYLAFSHIEVESVPEDITVGDKYIDGEFLKVERE